MFTLAQLLTACVVTAVLIAGVAALAARSWVENVRLEEQRRHAEAERQAREQYTRELQSLQQSLSGEVEALRARSLRPFKTLVDSLLS